MKNYNIFKGRPTFTRPPRDQLPLSLLFEYQGANSPEHPLFCYDEGGELKTIYWKDGIAAIRRAAGLVRDYVPRDGEGVPIVAVLAHVDSMTCFATLAGIMRAGYYPFPLSARNSPAAIAHLLRTKNVQHVLVNKEGPMKGLINASLQKSELIVHVHDMPTFDELYNSTKSVDLPPVEGVTQESVAVILHSSGSTAFPKPITLTMRMVMESAMASYYGDIDFGSQVLSAHAVPMFHLMGVIQLAWTTFLGLTVSVFPPTTPPIIPTPESVFNAAVATRCSLFYCVPSFVEALSQDPDKVKLLSKFHSVMYGGGPLETSTGDMLVKAGVKIVPLYGQTESGTIGRIFPSGPDPLGWQWMSLSEHLDPVFVPYEDLDNVYKLVLKKCPSHTPAILNTVIDGVPALDTFDLVERHPQDPRLFQIYGRADDQIIHSTGEKTNPVPIEAILEKDPHITNVIMFGRSKFHAGVIISPSPESVFGPEDTEKLTEYRTLIWPTVEKANEFAPAHSRIFKEMILVAHPNKLFEMTPKSTPRRNAVLRDYAEEIEAAYNAFDESSQSQFDPPKSWNTNDCVSFVRAVFRSVMKEDVELGDDDDIFQKGCDSLQMTWIKNTILHALKSNYKVNVREIPQNFVYTYSTARRLGDHMANLAQGKVLEPVDVASRARQMKILADKYCKNFPIRDAIADALKPDTPGAVLITGSTGYLGSYLLAKLLESKDFTKVYALNRPSNTALSARQEASFAARGLNTSLLQSSKLELLESDLSKEYLGLQNGVYGDIRDEVTLMIHNAWHVDFNISLSSLEPHLHGLRNLVDLALTSKRQTIPRLVFSTKNATLDWPKDKQGPEDYLGDPMIALSSGYSESKWCGETILHEAGLRTPLKPVILRVGQLSGGPNGEWNTTEWFPALVRSSQTLKRIPMLAGHVSWLPIDIAAQAIVELSDSNHQYANLVHPHPSPASAILEPIASLIGAEAVSYSQWIDELNKTSTDHPTRNPALGLLEFFQSHVASADKPCGEVLGFPSLSSTRALECSQSLRGLMDRRLDAKDVEKWIGYWRKIGFLDD
ncbi:hypothetical protein D9758_007201 [Tetrapyrgos nigripes]|uniref:Acetyl-CoA synthetase-like protein n=1 Tax=Tetrapyrgos nigripes TaxID=182062 RepID=A0A8H5FWD0_9AGAR|nr:hypothetical protein D9758_007201 [Tetrapyrgos nigripes]